MKMLKYNVKNREELKYIFFLYKKNTTPFRKKRSSDTRIYPRVAQNDITN